MEWAFITMSRNGFGKGILSENTVVDSLSTTKAFSLKMAAFFLICFVHFKTEEGPFGAEMCCFSEQVYRVIHSEIPSSIVSV